MYYHQHHLVYHPPVTSLPRFYAPLLSVDTEWKLRQSYILTTVFCHAEVLNDLNKLVRNDFISAGFEINNEESNFFPKAKGKIIDTVELTISVLNEKTHNFGEYDFNTKLCHFEATSKNCRTTFIHAFGFGTFSTTFY